MEKIRKVQLEKINKMLMEMAQGNFFYRLERTDTNDNVEAMTLILNMLAEEIQETLVHGGFVNSDGVVKHLIQMSFLMDQKGAIQMVNQHTSSILSYLHKDIIGRKFDEFLDKVSAKEWHKILQKTQSKDYYERTHELSFTTKDGLAVPQTCLVSMGIGSAPAVKRIMVTAVLFSTDRQERDELQRQHVFKKRAQDKLPIQNRKVSKKSNIRLSYEDVRKIRKGHQLILNNLEDDLPSLKEFAHQLGTNEFKLKYGFRELYGTTVYRFLLQERLRKAKMLIQHSDSPIKTIAYMTGFKSIPHFSRVFKKTYGYTPSELRQVTREIK